ncbi:45639_t:CDS:2 [Gigaspora margarita]|uniref:45639_t:CDS:1 n=1 Tax=Gigaspora margarita TaxID=4874 RepID=A0ABN7V709_GIGMA|nr:45639_t:CDS:2 [Gigaspora margarita]
MAYVKLVVRHSPTKLGVEPAKVKNYKNFLANGQVVTNAASQKSSMIRCYGMTQHPTEGYMLVLEYADEGNLRGYINRQHLLWTDKIYILRDIARALDFLHSRDFVHGDLHTGNVLKTFEKKPVLNLLGKNRRNRERELPPESKDLVKQLKSADTLAKMQFKRQTEEPILLPPPPTHSASVFTSKPLSPFVTASDFQSIRDADWLNI